MDRTEQPQEYRNAGCVERDIIAGRVKIHIKSVFNKQTSLEEAMRKIVTRKLTAKS